MSNESQKPVAPATTKTDQAQPAPQQTQTDNKPKPADQQRKPFRPSGESARPGAGRFFCACVTARRPIRLR
jgi:hypothetical protein